MRIYVAGLETRKAGEPVIVLESGAGGSLDHFAPILSDIRKLAPIVAYDRRGLGKSEWDGAPQTLERVARTLHDLLREAQIRPPYVLVGASWGGHYIRKFASLFPTEVVGLVHLDTSDTPTRSELASLPPGATEAIFELPPIPDDVPPGLRAEIESIAKEVRRSSQK